MIPLAKPYINEEEIKLVNEVLKSNRLSFGPKLREFEEKFAQKIGTKYAVAVNSGTSGLHLCIKSLSIKECDEVITSPFSFVSSANCMLFEKAKPVFVDIEEDTFNINPKLIKEKITDKTKAILPVHIFGQSCDMDQIKQIADNNNLKIIEDACESILATYKGKNVGTFGDAAVFAFYPNKQMTTGEGGMIVTDNKNITQICQSLRNQGRSNNMGWLTHERLGYNYRMDEISSALGLAQLNKINYLIKRRQEIANLYIEELSGVEGVILPKTRDYNQHSWFVFPIQVSENIRDKLIKSLLKQGIQSKAYFYPCIHLQPFYRKQFNYQEGDFPIAEKVSKTTLILPFFPQITHEEILKVKKVLQESLSLLNR